MTTTRTPHPDDCGHDHATEQEAWECERRTSGIRAVVQSTPAVWAALLATDINGDPIESEDGE